MSVRFFALTLLACSCAAHAPRPVQCTYVYGGEEKVISVEPTAEHYSVPLVEYLIFREIQQFVAQSLQSGGNHPARIAS